MTRVLFWNINNFGTNGFFPGPNTRPRTVGDDGEYGAPAATADAEDRLGVLLGVIENVDPDIISIVEVQPGANGLAPGQLVRDEAAAALYRRIRNLPFAGADEFGLVPPLVVGQGGVSEGIAVYYRTDRLYFLGPYGWGGGHGQPVAELGGAAGLAEYPQVWDRGLPNREIPVGWPNAGCREDRLAGQYAFQREGKALNFPMNRSRAPWLTWFGEIGGTGLLKLLSFHASPDPEIATRGIQQLAQITEMTEAIGNDEVRCIVGDFNVSSLIEEEMLEAFNPLAEAGYTMSFNPEHNVPERRRDGYYTTLLKASRYARPWVSDRGGAVVFGYPAFDYMGDRYGSNAIDNALTWHGPEAGGTENQTVCNPVVGAPYTLDNEPPAGVLRGTMPVGTYLAQPHLFEYEPPAHPGVDGAEHDADDVTDNFVEWQNYTHIRSCSDHLPIALDI